MSCIDGLDHPGGVLGSFVGGLHFLFFDFDILRADKYWSRKREEERAADEVAVFLKRERGRGSGRRMSGGIARGRLAEERKSWRKNHPHVFYRSFPLLSPCFFASFLALG